MEVVCLHGMGRTPRSMRKMGRHLSAHGVHAVDYGRHVSLEQATETVAAFLRAQDLATRGDELRFVVHSAGGVVVRALSTVLPDFRCGPSVTLGSPLRGSILAERYKDSVVLNAVYGQIFRDLHPAAVAALPPLPCDVGSIAGTRWTPVLPSSLLLRPLAGGRPSDSTVLVEETRIEGVVAVAEIHCAHTFLPSNHAALTLTSRFLASGKFS